jgi:hypothetical protein
MSRQYDRDCCIEFPFIDIFVHHIFLNHPKTDDVRKNPADFIFRTIDYRFFARLSGNAERKDAVHSCPVTEDDAVGRSFYGNPDDFTGITHQLTFSGKSEKKSVRMLVSFCEDC